MTFNMTGKNKDWWLISSCSQVEWLGYYHDQSIKTTGKNKNWYQVAAKWEINCTHVDVYSIILRYNFTAWLYYMKRACA